MLLHDLPLAVQLMKPSERKQLALLRARLVRERIGPCERALRRVGRWMDMIRASCR
ncbi:hypothetical protein [Bradyrhizobium sp. AS23.2]|uniref:hypothetical protein n=1 Tax=Bradyrhizobium sp. AS23.2 TaxID=1680155 RepID=UPI00142FBD1D|nr:hypothetical protein [Bradyrhizobium sp. AS23.2]